MASSVVVFFIGITLGLCDYAADCIKGKLRNYTAAPWREVSKNEYSSIYNLQGSLVWLICGLRFSLIFWLPVVLTWNT